MNREQFCEICRDVEKGGMAFSAMLLLTHDREQREALARVEADHEANGLEYGEALILIGQVLDCRSFEDLNAVRRYLNEFMDRYSLRPVPDVDIGQAEQQEAQGAQADEFHREDRYIVIKRKDLVALHRDAFGPTQVAIEAFYAGLRSIELQLPRRDYLVIEGDWPEYEPTWAAIQARVEAPAALATHPAAGDPVRVVVEPCEELSPSNLVGNRIDRMLTIGTRLYTDPPAAAHGDEAVASAKQLAESLKLVRRWERPGQATEWEFEVPGSFNRHVVASSEQAARAKIAQDVRREAPPAAAHGDELVAVVGTVPDGSGFKSLDFKVELQDLPDGTRLYAQGVGGAST